MKSKKQAIILSVIASIALLVLIVGAHTFKLVVEQVQVQT